MEIKPNHKTKLKVLVTGANGFVGSHLLEALLEKDYDVVGLLEPGDSPACPENQNLKFVFSNITQKDSIAKVLSGFDNFDYIYHLAAILEGCSDETFYKINYQGTINLVEACFEKNIHPRKFLFVSSIAAVGPTGKDNLLEETAPCCPVNAYGNSKKMTEEYLRSLDKLPFTIVRLPLVYGPRSKSGLRPIFYFSIKGLQLANLEGETNIAFVEDIVGGIIKAAESSNTLHQTYFLGERSYTSREVLEMIEKACGRRATKIYIPLVLLYLVGWFLESVSRLTKTKPLMGGDEFLSYLKHRYWRFDTTKAVKDFGYETKYPLEAGAKITVDWYKKFKK